VGRTDDITKIDRAIKETEARLKTLQINIDALDLEIKKFLDFENTLLENVKILKTKRVIAIAQEFKKSKEELKRVKGRLVVLRNDREHFNKVFQDTDDVLKGMQSQLQKILTDGENNVLSFRREDGKE
jgi:uncharacterized protein YoxC